LYQEKLTKFVCLCVYVLTKLKVAFARGLPGHLGPQVETAGIEQCIADEKAEIDISFIPYYIRSIIFIIV